MKRHTMLVLGTAIAVVLAVSSPGALGFGASHGALKNVDGVAGCVSETGAASGGASCTDGKALKLPEDVAVSPDGKNVYAVASGSSAVSAFARNATTGELTQLPAAAGCVSETGAGPCADGKALLGPYSVAVSPDGKNVYVVSALSKAIAVFTRDPVTGKLSQLAGTAGCVSETGAGPCLDGKALEGAFSVAVSPDGKNVYVASIAAGNAVAVFARFLPTGQLRQLGGPAGCVSETGSSGACTDGKALNGAWKVAVSPDGKNVYVASRDSDAVAVFARSTATGALTQLAGNDGCVSETGAGPCADGKALNEALAVAVSPDGKHVYTTAADSSGGIAQGAVAVFKRSASGALTQLPGSSGCVSETGSGPCADGKAIRYPDSLALSPNGRSLYVTGATSDAVAVFVRNATTGALVQLPGTDGCISPDGSGGDCGDGWALDGPRGIAVTADARHVYVAVSGDAPGDRLIAGLTRHP